jgi:hypothetical protein
MHFLLHIADWLDVEWKSDEDASCDDLKVSTRDDLTSMNRIIRESRSDRKIISESKIIRIEKIMQINNASSYQQLIYCNRQRENKSQKSSFFERYVVIRKMQIC